jgi:hypothetical protein
MTDHGSTRVFQGIVVLFFLGMIAGVVFGISAKLDRINDHLATIKQQTASSPAISATKKVELEQRR